MVSRASYLKFTFFFFVSGLFLCNQNAYSGRPPLSTRSPKKKRAFFRQATALTPSAFSNLLRNNPRPFTKSQKKKGPAPYVGCIKKKQRRDQKKKRQQKKPSATHPPFSFPKEDNAHPRRTYWEILHFFSLNAMPQTRHANVSPLETHKESQTPRETKGAGIRAPEKEGEPEFSRIAASPPIDHTRGESDYCSLPAYGRPPDYRAPRPKIYSSFHRRNAKWVPTKNSSSRTDDLTEHPTTSHDYDSRGTRSAKNGGANASDSSQPRPDPSTSCVRTSSGDTHVNSQVYGSVSPVQIADNLHTISIKISPSNLTSLLRRVPTYVLARIVAERGMPPDERPPLARTLRRPWRPTNFRFSYFESIPEGDEDKSSPANNTAQDPPTPRSPETTKNEGDSGDTAKPPFTRQNPDEPQNKAVNTQNSQPAPRKKTVEATANIQNAETSSGRGGMGQAQEATEKDVTASETAPGKKKNNQEAENQRRSYEQTVMEREKYLTDLWYEQMWPRPSSRKPKKRRQSTLHYSAGDGSLCAPEHFAPSDTSYAESSESTSSYAQSSFDETATDPSHWYAEIQDATTSKSQ